MKNDIKNISTVLFRKYGIDISMYEDSFLKMSLEKRMTVNNSPSFSDYCNILAENRTEAGLLFDSLHINFSEFFRNPLTFDYLEKFILPIIIERKKQNDEKEIRIWCAACAKGEEAYSIAMLFEEIAANSELSLNCRIFATDINEKEIGLAQMGVYQEAALSKVSLNRAKRFFTQRGEKYTVIHKLKEYIDFSVFDLLIETGHCPPASIYGNFDLVFCCNLLFYYKPEYRQRILNKAGDSIAKNGYLVTGETEREIAKKQQFKEVFANSAIFQKRG